MSTTPVSSIDMQEFMVPYLLNGLTRLQTVNNNLVYFFGVIAVVFVAFRYVMATEETQMQSLRWLAPQLLTMITIVWLAANIGDVAYVLHASLTKAGMMSGGFDETVTPLYNPQLMLLLTTRVFEIMVSSCKVIDWLNPFTLVGAIVGILSLIAAGIILFLFTLIKIYHFKMIVIAGSVMIPPGLWTRTATIAEDWITHVLNAGLSMFMLAVCVSLPYDFFKDLNTWNKVSCSAVSFLWIGVGFLAWALVTVSMTQSFSRLISKAITLYGSK